MRAEGKSQQLEFRPPEERVNTSGSSAQGGHHSSRTIHHAPADRVVSTASGTEAIGPASRKVKGTAATVNLQDLLTRVRALQVSGGPFCDIEVDGLINELKLPAYHFYDEDNLPDSDARLMFSILVELQGLCDGISDKGRGAHHYQYLERQLSWFVGRLSDNKYRRQQLAIEFVHDVLQRGVRDRECKRKILSSLQTTLDAATFSAPFRISGTEPSLIQLCFLRKVANLINQYRIKLPSSNCYRFYQTLAIHCCLQGEYAEAKEYIEQACQFEKQNRRPHFLEVVDVLSRADRTRDVSEQADKILKELEARKKQVLCLTENEISDPKLKEELVVKCDNMGSDELYSLTERACSTAEDLLLCRAQRIKASFREKLNFSTLTSEQMPLQESAFVFLKACCQGAFKLALCSDSVETLSLYHRIRGVIDLFPIPGSRELLHKQLFSAYVNILYWLPEEVFSEASRLGMFPDGIEIEKSLIASNALRHNKKYPEALAELEKVQNKAVEYHCHKAFIVRKLTGNFSDAYSELEKARVLLRESGRKRDVYLYHKRMAFILSEAAAMPEIPEELSTSDRDEIYAEALEHAVVARHTMKPRTSPKLDALIKTLKGEDEQVSTPPGN